MNEDETTQLDSLAGARWEDDGGAIHVVWSERVPASEDG